MKFAILSLVFASALALPALAEKEHTHEKRPEGPHGGRVITSVEPHLEFLVTPERKVEISALTEDLKPTKLTGQTISVVAGERNAPTKLELKESDGKLVSANVLPAGDGLPVSVGIKPAGGGKTVYEKFYLELEKCPTCRHAEYACTCAHAHDDAK